MRQPGRLHITWADDDTLRVEFDAGTQTRLLELGTAAAAPAGEPTWQGFSRAEWQRPPGGSQAPVRAQIGNSAGPSHRAAAAAVNAAARRRRAR